MLAQHYDAALFDLDGVIYLGPHAIDGVADALRRLRDAGIRVGFVTNNAARTPQTVAEHLVELGIEASVNDVVNSTMATIRMLRETLPAGARVLAVGTDALATQLTEAGFTVVESRAEQPMAVVQGYSPTMDWALLEEGALAIAAGAQWFATNPDLTRPTERGIVPGCGAQIAVIQVCVRAQPRIAGKPFPPLLDETVRRMLSQRPIFVGDRLDTDILGANRVGMDSLFVFTGAHGKQDLLAATAEFRPSAIGYDMGALLQPHREATLEDGLATCGTQRLRIIGEQVLLDTQPVSRDEQLDALWAALQLHWTRGLEVASVVEILTDLP